MRNSLLLKLVKFIKITGPISGLIAALSPLVLLIANGNYQSNKNLALRYRNYPVIKFFIKDSSTPRHK